MRLDEKTKVDQKPQPNPAPANPPDEPNPGDPGPPMLEPRQSVDPSEDSRIPPQERPAAY